MKVNDLQTMAGGFSSWVGGFAFLWESF